jgi:hypothetical protein
VSDHDADPTEQAEHPFHRAAAMAGFFAAHGVWSVCSGDDMEPLVAYQRGDEREARRFVSEDPEQAVDEARAFFETNPEGADRAVLLLEGLLGQGDDPQVPDRDSAVLVVHAIEYGPSPRKVTAIVPFRPSTSPEGFGVYPAGFADLEGLDSADLDGVAAAFFGGVGQHEQGSAAWEEHLLEDAMVGGLGEA